MSTLLVLRIFLSDLPPQVWADRKQLEEQTRGYLVWRRIDLRPAMQVLRAAVTGSVASPPIFEVLEILGRDEVLGRLDDALPDENRRKVHLTGAEPWRDKRPVMDEDARALLRRDAGADV